MNTKIKEWYASEFTEDEFGISIIDDSITFEDLKEKLDNYLLSGYFKIYQYLLIKSNVDSLIRERVFHKLANLMNVEYDYVYNKWLGKIHFKNYIDKYNLICKDN